MSDVTQEEMELKELAELEELAKLEELDAQEAQPEVQPGQTHFVNPETGRTEKLPEGIAATPEEVAQQDIEMAKAAGLGALEGVPKHIVSAVEAGVDSVAGDEEFGESYEKNVEEWNGLIDKAKLENPTAFNTADIATGFAIPGLGGAKVVQSGAKLGKALGFGAGVISAGTSSAARSRDEELADDFLAGATIGAAFPAGIAAGKSIAQLSKSGLAKAMKWVRGGSVIESVAGPSKKAANELIDHAKKFNPGKSKTEALNSFADDVVEYKATDDRLLIDPRRSMDEMSDEAFKLKQSFGSEIGKELRKADAKIESLDAEELYHRIRDDINLNDMLADVADTDIQKLGQEVDDYLKANFLKVNKVSEEFSQQAGQKIVKETGFKGVKLSELHRKKVSMSDRLNYNREMTPMQQKKKDIVSSMQKIIGEKVDEIGLDNFGNYAELNRHWANANQIEKITAQAVKNQVSTPQNVMRQIFSLRGMVLGGVTGDLGMGLALNAGLQKLVKSPKVSQSLAVGITKLSDIAAKEGTKSPLVKRLMVASAVNDDKFRTALASVFGEIELQEQGKVERTVNDVIMKSDHILPALKFHDKSAYNELKEAIETEDSERIGAIMDQVGKMPGAKKFIKDGLGFDGKVYTEEDKASLEGQVNTMDISLSQKLQHKKALREGGVIPVIQQEPERFFQVNKRDKDKPNY